MNYEALMSGRCCDCGEPVPKHRHKRRCHSCWRKLCVRVDEPSGMVISDWATDERGHLWRTVRAE
jgi:hypothetical protein